MLTVHTTKHNSVQYTWQTCMLSNSWKMGRPLAAAWELQSAADSPLGERGRCKGAAVFAVRLQAAVCAESAILQGLQSDCQVATVEDVVAVNLHPEVCSRGVPSSDSTCS